MEKNKIIVIALIVVIIAFLVGIFAVMPGEHKQDTNLTFMGNDTINEGDSIEIKLTDANGTALANQTVNVTITDGNKSTDSQTVVTTDGGVGTLKLNKSAGEYNVTIVYSGKDNYNACNATKMITIKNKVIEESASQQSTQSSSSSSGLHYDPEVNVYYDDNGIIVDPDGQHFQGAGESYSKYRDARDRWERGEPVMV